jgi:hypothetical protein
MLLDGTGDRIDALEYPLTTEELAERLGDHELDCPGETTLGEALEPLAGETFETAEEARFAVQTGVDESAIGRKEYSDRDPGSPGEDGPRQVSF